MVSDDMTVVTVCLGSSCFTRGNDMNLPRIQAWLKGRGLEERVLLKGSRCEGKCQCGPNLRIGDELVHGVDLDALLDVLERKLC
jgi:NADH:ubiquinone oxidoreductase subunit E